MINSINIFNTFPKKINKVIIFHYCPFLYLELNKKHFKKDFIVDNSKMVEFFIMLKDQLLIVDLNTDNIDGFIRFWPFSPKIHIPELKMKIFQIFQTNPSKR